MVEKTDDVKVFEEPFCNNGEQYNFKIWVFCHLEYVKDHLLFILMYFLNKYIF